MLKKTKLTELENKILDISGLAAKTALTAVDNNTPDVNSSIKKTNYDKKLVSLKKNLMIIIVTNVLLLQSLIL